MRVLFVTPYYVPAYAFGGPVRMAEVMVGDLLAAGHEVTVATTDALDATSRVPREAPAEPVGAKVLRFPNLHHGLAANAMGWTPRGYLRWIRRGVREVDVVVLHDVYSVLSVAAARAAVRAGVPYVLQPFGSLAPSAERGKPLIKRAFLTLWGRRTLREAAALVHSTEHERRDFLDAGAPEGRLVPMPLPLELADGAGEPLAEEPTLAFVGRLDPIKGVDRLLRALAIARRSLPTLTLDLLGPGDAYRARMEALARELGVERAVRFHGYVEMADKVRMLERAHVGCLLSHSEGLPVAALEAMACGTPVVLSTGCHLDEVDGVAGVVTSGEPEETARAIVALLQDEPRRTRLGDGARAFAQPFHRERVMPMMIELLDGVVAEHEERAACPA